MSTAGESLRSGSCAGPLVFSSSQHGNLQSGINAVFTQAYMRMTEEERNGLPFQMLKAEAAEQGLQPCMLPWDRSPNPLQSQAHTTSHVQEVAQKVGRPNVEAANYPKSLHECSTSEAKRHGKQRCAKICR